MKDQKPVEDLSLESLKPKIDEEQIEQTIKQKEEQIRSLTLQLYDKEHQIEYLKKSINDQETNFNTIIARLVISLMADK